VNSSRLVERFQ